MRRLTPPTPLFLLPLLLTACGGSGARGEACDPAEAGFCEGDLVCAAMQDGGHACHPRLVLRGSVVDTTDLAALEGAQVVVVDGEGAAASDVAVTDEAGDWEAAVPAVRDADGRPLASLSFTLRADAAGYQTFPGGLRAALPIGVGDARELDGVWVLDPPPTTVGLVPRPEGDAGFQVEGHVAGDAAGVLVVAAGGGETRATVSDRNGRFTLFDVASGFWTLRGYRAGLQLTTADVTVDGADVDGVELGRAETGLATVTGNLQIVNAPGGVATSVILVVADTFDPVSLRGEVPPGLRAPRAGAPDVTGDWTIEGVPTGSYVVLAAFENDGLVRDPDTSIGGTEIVTLNLHEGTTGTVPVPQSFKVTEALTVHGPGAEGAEAVTGDPVLTWADDSSEDAYQVVVYDTFGDVIWEHSMAGVSGSDRVSVTYAGPALETGMYYQFRATSLKGDVPLSTTEDLKGVFYVP